jgi:MFS family permease
MFMGAILSYQSVTNATTVNAPSFNKTFDTPASDMIGLIVAIYESKSQPSSEVMQTPPFANLGCSIVGCFFGSIASAMFGEKLGRRKSITIGAWIMIVGAVLQASAFGRAQLIVGRIVSGVGMGMINSTVPVFQAEFSPKSSRGVCE